MVETLERQASTDIGPLGVRLMKPEDISFSNVRNVVVGALDVKRAYEEGRGFIPTNYSEAYQGEQA
ncbi:MAG: hypothetical protein WCK29_04485 [archaeon]